MMGYGGIRYEASAADWYNGFIGYHNFLKTVCISVIRQLRGAIRLKNRFKH